MMCSLLHYYNWVSHMNSKPLELGKWYFMPGTILRTGITWNFVSVSSTHISENDVYTVKAVTKYNLTPGVQNFLFYTTFAWMLAVNTGSDGGQSKYVVSSYRNHLSDAVNEYWCINDIYQKYFEINQKSTYFRHLVL